MNAPVAAMIGAGIGTALVAVPMVLTRRTWTRRAHKLAQRSDIALPPDLEPRVAGWLRRRFIVNWALYIPMVPFWQTLFGSDFGRQPHLVAPRSFLVVLVLAPLAVVIYGFVLALPAWNSAKRRGTAHLAQTPVLRAFGRSEWVVIGLAVGLAAVAGVVGLLRIAAGPWALAWPLTIAVGAATWWWSSKVIMQCPSRATNALELGWDDVVRYQKVRELTIGAAFFPVLIACFVDIRLFGETILFGPMFPLSAVVVAVLIWRIFDSGRYRWRQEWPQPTS